MCPEAGGCSPDRLRARRDPGPVGLGHPLRTALPLRPILTFEERVEGQEAIERVYYAHQIDASRRFEEAVPRRVLVERASACGGLLATVLRDPSAATLRPLAVKNARLGGELGGEARAEGQEGELRLL